MTGPTTLEIDVWQFVRIMDALETAPGKRRPLFFAWRDAWDEIDARLTTLAREDPAAYAELMMDRQVVLPLDSAAKVDDAIAAAEDVVRRLSDSLSAGSQDPHLRDSLRFEKRETQSLLHRLATLRRKIGKNRRKPHTSE